jgi:hypothetical protein
VGFVDLCALVGAGVDVFGWWDAMRCDAMFSCRGKLMVVRRLRS